MLPVSHSKTAPDAELEEEEEDDGGKYAELKLIELREMSAADSPQKGSIGSW